jgi:transcriptional regulator with XRE-family HTH domain
MNKYGLRLKELREENGYTQETLAKKLNTSRSRIGMYEQGKRQPDFEMQEALADTFNVSIDYLFGRDPSIVVETESRHKSKALELYAKYLAASPDVQKAVELMLKSAQPKP